MKSEKLQMTEGIEPPNQEKIRTLGKKGNLGILKVDITKYCRDERKEFLKIPQENAKTTGN